MTAPALILLAPNSHDDRSDGTIIELTHLVNQTRPDISAHPAFAHDASTVIDHLVAEGHQEIVVVPALIAGEDPQHIRQLVTACAARLPEISIVVSDTLGMAPSLLNVVDERMRTALSQHRVRELDALVLAGPGSPDSAVNTALTRAARIWGKHHNLPTIAAFGAHVPPAVSEAVRAHRSDGRRHIAVGRLFLTHSELSAHVSELAYEAGAIAVSEPLGAHAELSWLALTRYSVGSLQLLPLENASASL